MTNNIELVTTEKVSNGCSKAVKPIYGLAYLNELGIQGMGCEGACEMTPETSVQSACVRAFFPLVTPTHVRPHTFLTFQGKLMDISDFICEL